MSVGNIGNIKKLIKLELQSANVVVLRRRRNKFPEDYFLNVLNVFYVENKGVCHTIRSCTLHLVAAVGSLKQS